jgi:hypothetical protein
VDPHLETLQRALLSAAEDSSAGRMHQPAAGKWSVVEILEHLSLTYTGTTKGMSRVLEAGKPLGTVATWKQRSRKFVVLGLGYLPSGREAPSMTRPKGLPPEKVLAEIGSKIAEMDNIIRACERKFGSRVKVLDHPILGPLTAAQWRRFHCIHGKHHLTQIQRLKSGA